MIEYPNPYVLKLRDWIDINKLNWTELTQNQNSPKPEDLNPKPS